jgi:RNA polymerase sigma factor (sigma-70 family)
MCEGANGDLLGPLRRLVAPPTDAELLERFRAGGDGAAFAELVRRHGPMVFGVCRRVLADVHLAEDAFQAAFLVLARRAGAVRRPDRLGPWLFGVARRTARRARRLTARQVPGAATVPRVEASPAAEAERRDLGAALQSEVERLPTAFREAVELCYRDGHSKREAADRLGCSAGTVSSRLARGRALLRLRLTGRGWAPAAAVSAGLADSAVRSAALVRAGGRGPVDGVSAEVWDLSEGVMHMMGRGKRVALLGVVLALAGVSGLGVLAQPAPRPGPAGPGDRPAAREAPPPVLRPADAAVQAELKKLEGDWSVARVSGNPDPHGLGINALTQERAMAFRINTGVPTRWVFRDGSAAIKPGKRTEIGFTLDPSQSHKWIDMTVTDLTAHKSFRYHGIYQLQGEGPSILKVMLTPAPDPETGDKGEPRPEEFEIDPDSRNVLFHLERIPHPLMGMTTTGFAGLSMVPSGSVRAPAPAGGSLGSGGTAPGALARAAPAGGGDSLRREVELLRLELRRAQAEIDLLKAELALLKATGAGRQ